MTATPATSHAPGRKPGPSAYARGCRCQECTDLHRERMAAVRAALAQRPREEVPHGTVGGYRNWSCRCEPCGAAHLAACRAWRESRKAARPLSTLRDPALPGPALQAGGGA